MFPTSRVRQVVMPASPGWVVTATLDQSTVWNGMPSSFMVRCQVSIGASASVPCFPLLSPIVKTSASIAVVAISISLTSAARAEPSPPKITNNNYAIDVFDGPVNTASRVIGGAGAYTAIAEDCEGEYSNAASPGIRTPYSTSRWDYDICFDFTNPGAFGKVDLENRGVGYTNQKNRFSNAFAIAPGMELQYRTLGITVDGYQTRFGVGGTDLADAPSSIVLNRITASIANSFVDDQLVLGFGFRVALLDIDQRVGGQDVNVVSNSGFGYQVGAIFKPKKFPFRLGATFRSQITLSDIPGDFTTKNGFRAVGEHSQPFLVPDRVQIPWELEVGAALELGSRPFNRTRPDAALVEDQLRAIYEQKKLERAKKYQDSLLTLPAMERESQRKRFEMEESLLQQKEDEELGKQIDALRAEQRAEIELWSRGKILLMSSILITGNTAEGVDLADAIGQLRVRSGESIGLSPRIALETELIRHWLTARGGAYLEPARLAGSNSRGHATLGVDVRLFKFNPWGLFGEDPWRIRIANDFAPRYFNYGLSLGKYH